MAATGLLGVNPYYKGVEIDVSKPVNLAIQLEQKNQAKREAIDKYFMDYEKSLNPAGMRQQDQDVFLRKLQENKEYYLKNREKILNPAKYGAEAQSEYMSRFKGILSDIDRSKQLAANGKVLSQAVLDARKSNKTIPQEVLDGIFNNELSMGDKRHVTFDPFNFDAYDKLDQEKFKKGIYSNVKPSESAPQRIEDKVNREVYYKTITDINKNSFSEIQNAVASELKKDRGLNDEIVSISNDQNRLNQLGQVYNTFTGGKMNPNSLLDVATAYAIALRPAAVEKFTTPKESTEYARMKKIEDALNLARRKKDLGLDGASPLPEGNLFDTLPDLDLGKGGKIENGVAIDQDGNALNGKVYLEKINIPTEILDAMGVRSGDTKVKGFDVTFVNGSPQQFVNKVTGTLTRQAMINKQLKLNTEPQKGRQPVYGPTKGKETLAERMRRLKNPK
jgi:hypothetical protein